MISLDGIASANLASVAADAALVARDQGRADEIRELRANEDAALKAAGKPIPDRGRIPNDHGGSWAPGTLYNAMIEPFTRYTIKGSIWYQGESDATPERAPHYECVFSALIQDRRRQWGEGAFPFLFVQISSWANHDADWGRLRDAQRRVSEEVKNVGMAVTLDVGLADNIHPPDKQTVAARLALLARPQAYGEDVASSSPSFQRATIEGNSMRVWFSDAAGLKASVEPVGDFEAAGDDRQFAPATGRIEGNTVVVSSSAVTSPRFVR